MALYEIVLMTEPFNVGHSDHQLWWVWPFGGARSSVVLRAAADWNPVLCDCPEDYNKHWFKCSLMSAALIDSLWVCQMIISAFLGDYVKKWSGGQNTDGPQIQAFFSSFAVTTESWLSWFPSMFLGLITMLRCTSTNAHKSQHPLDRICSFQKNISNIGL